MYQCNRSGTYQPVAKEKRKRKEKQQGSRKIGQDCIAKVIAHEVTSGELKGYVEVEAILTHYGHECDITHISLSKEERALLQGKWIVI